MGYDIEAAWQINDFCNFDCVYCWLHNKDWSKRKRFIGQDNTQKVLDGFDRTGIKWLIHMSGGEPFFFPNFIKLCQRLTKNNFISINTNLSHKDTFRFAELIAPERVNFIHCSLHIQQRKKTKEINDFISKYQFLQKRGFNIFASYLMYPHLISRFKKAYARFKSEGIILKPKVFWGNCTRFRILDSIIFKRVRRFFGRRYPDGYTDKQKILIKSYMDTGNTYGGQYKTQAQGFREQTVDLTLDRNWIDKLPSFKGQLCRAGKNFVKMDQDGKVFRCNDEPQHYLGNLFNSNIKLFDKTTECSSDICSCPYVGYRYANAAHRKLNQQ